MGAIAFAGRKFAGIACAAVGFFFALAFYLMGAFRPEYQWAVIAAIVIMVTGLIFGIYFWRSADRHV